MKKFRKYLSIYLSIFIFIIGCYKPIIVKADLTQNVFSQTTVSIGGVNVNAYEYTDPSLLSNTIQVYWVENNEVYRAPLDDAFTVIFNKTFGLAVKPSFLSNFLIALNGSLWGSGLMLTEFFSGCPGFVYNGSSIVGVALDNLTNFSLAGDNNFTQMSIPSSVVNNVWNEWNDYIEANSVLDFINTPCLDKSYALDAVSNNNSTYQNTIDLINNSSDTLFGLGYTNGKFYSTGYYANENTYFNFGNVYFVCSNSSDLDNYISDYGLSSDDYTIELSQIINASSVSNISAKPYSITTNSAITSADKYSVNGGSSNTSVSNVPLIYASYKLLPYKQSGGYITLYRQPNIIQQITNNTYSKNYYTSNKTNNYSTSNNNTTNITNNDYSNASQNNTNIYNQSQTTTNNNTTENNYYYDQSTNDNSVTTIINNYYPENGGSGDDDDNDDDTIWKALLKAIGDFFKKIGELLTVVLTGLISICTSVLDAIASITESFSGVTDFISAIFGFLPSEVVAVITLGLTLAVLISLIRIIRR